MEVTSSLSKTFKIFSMPRSTSSMGSFTTSNGTATNLEQKYDESTPPSTSQTTPSNGHSSSNHKHPPLSYVQHIRPIQHHSQQNLSTSSQEQQQQQQQQQQLPKQKFKLPTRPLSGDISSFMTRSASSDFYATNDYLPKENNVVQLYFNFCSFLFSCDFSLDKYLNKKIFTLQILHTT